MSCVISVCAPQPSYTGGFAALVGSSEPVFNGLLPNYIIT